MEVIHTIGRRKTSVARIFLSEGNGSMTVNKKEYKDYFPTPALQYKVVQPFALTGTEGNYDVKITSWTSPNKSKQDRKYVIFKHLLRTHSKNQVARCFLVMFGNISSHSKRW